MVGDFKCYFCGSAKYKKLIVSGVFYRCKKCGLITLSEEEQLKNPKDYYSETYYPEGYNGRINLKSAFLYRLACISKFVKKGSKVLEVGAASGDFLNIIKRLGYQVAGVELSKRASEKAKELYGLEVLNGSLAEANFLENSFEAVLAYHVIEHIKDLRPFLKEVYRVLRPGGILLAEVPNPCSIDAHLSKRLLGSILDYPNHVYGFPPKVLVALLEEAGFGIIYEEKSFSFLISQFFSRKNKAKGAKVVNVAGGQSENFGRIEDYEFRSVWKRWLAQILPGMKYTLVAKK